MQFLNRSWPKHAYQFGGGGRSAQQIQSAPVPLPAPPVTQNNEAVIQAQQDVARANLQKKGFKSTIYAGDTGGFKGGMGFEKNLGPRA